MHIFSSGITIADSLKIICNCLTHQVDLPRLEAEILVAKTLNVSRTHLFAWPEQSLTDAQCELLQTLLRRRLLGEPIAYLQGTKEFWSLTLEVSPATLIPRPETELLVEVALNKLSAGTAVTVADLGTGSGAIALALASEKPSWRILATDKSAEALAVAARNKERLALNNIEFYEGAWYQALPQATTLSAIISNPPYIAKRDSHLSEGDIRFEPLEALVADQEGLADLQHIIQHAAAYLQPAGWLILEHGWQQADAVAILMKNAGFDVIKHYKDLSGHLRVTLGQLNPQIAACVW